MTPNQLRDQREHKEALKRFKGRMPNGPTQPMKMPGHVLRLHKIGRGESLGEWI